MLRFFPSPCSPASVAGGAFWLPKWETEDVRYSAAALGISGETAGEGAKITQANTSTPTNVMTDPNAIGASNAELPVESMKKSEAVDNACGIDAIMHYRPALLSLGRIERVIDAKYRACRPPQQIDVRVRWNNIVVLADAHLQPDNNSNDEKYNRGFKK
jgi:hypothetical protein